MIIVGIDPGLHGAVVVLGDEFKLLDYFDCPTIASSKTVKGKKRTKHEFAPVEMASIIHGIQDKYQGDTIRVWLEQARSMSQQGLSSTFKTGRGFGLWEGIIGGARLPYEIIAPNVWTKVMFRGTPLGDPKGRSLLKAHRLFPNLPLKTPKGHVLSLDGRSDASLIAYYGMLQTLGLEHKPEVPVSKKADWQDTKESPKSTTRKVGPKIKKTPVRIRR